MECEILIKIPQGISTEWISSDCHSAFVAVVLQYSNSLHWSILFSYHVKSSDSCIGIYNPLEANLAFKSKSEAVELCCKNCGQSHTCVFVQLACAIPRAPLLLSPLHSFTEKMDKAGRKPKWNGELEVRSTSNPTHCAQAPLGISFARLLRELFWKSQYGSMQSGVKGWDTELVHKDVHSS